MVKKQHVPAVGVVDLGTHGVRSAVGAWTEHGWNLLGWSESPSDGMLRGGVDDTARLANVLRQTVAEAQAMAGQRVRSWTFTFGGGKLASSSSHGVVPIKRGAIEHADIERVVDAARAVPIPDHHRVLHLWPQAFAVDGVWCEQDPMGRSGVRLEANVHMVTLDERVLERVLEAAEQAGCEVADVVCHGLASSRLVLDEVPPTTTVAVIDMGAGTTDTWVARGGRVVYTSSLPLGGQLVTNDVAVALRSGHQAAEATKCTHGSLYPEADDFDVLVEGVEGTDLERHVSHRLLSDVIHARYKELFALVKADLARSGALDGVERVVLTGGANMIPGAAAMVETMFHVPTNLGKPSVDQGQQVPSTWSSLDHAAILGLLDYVAEPSYHQDVHAASSSAVAATEKPPALKRVAHWLAEHF